MMHRSFTFVLFALIPLVNGFSPQLPQLRTEVPSQLNLFGGLADAFKNDDKLGKPQNSGLKNGPQYNENVTVNGKQVPGAVAGQKLTVVANKVRVKIPVNCQKVRSPLAFDLM